MQGSERLDRELLDTLVVCGDLIPLGSVYRFLAEHRLAVFGDELFADLFSGRGRPSQPASVIAVVLVLQALEGVSDREAIERLRCDLRWKAAAGLSLTDGAFHPSVLTLWRARLRRSDRPRAGLRGGAGGGRGDGGAGWSGSPGVGFDAVGRRGGDAGHRHDDLRADTALSPPDT